MTKKSEKKFPEINFRCSASPWCCGVAEVGSFLEEDDGYNWFTKRATSSEKKYTTRREQAEACYENIIKRTGKTGDDQQAYAQLLITLVSKYKDRRTAQFPELAALLKERGWEEYSTFRNPNHGNKVTLYGLRIPQRERMRNPYGSDW